MKLSRKLLAYAAPVLLMLTTSLPAQPRDDIGKTGWETSMGLSVFAMDSENAAEQGLGESAFGLEIAGNYFFKRSVVASLGFGVVNIKDKEKFTQQVTVTDLFGSDVESAKSSVTSFPLFAEISYRSLADNDNGLGYRLGAGLTQFVLTERSISKCIGCRSDELSIDGGAYVTAGASFNRSNSSKFGVSIRQYVSGDVKTSVLLWLEFD